MKRWGNSAWKPSAEWVSAESLLTMQIRSSLCVSSSRAAENAVAQSVIGGLLKLLERLL